MLQKNVPYLELSQINEQTMSYYNISDVNSGDESGDMEWDKKEKVTCFNPIKTDGILM